MRRIGLVVNPIAGMGGRVGLKGTDGVVDRARELGAEPRAPERAEAALEALARVAPETAIATWGGRMGEDEARSAGFEPSVLGAPTGEETSAADTRAAVAAVVEAGVDAILFVGGDGTAVDVAETLDDLDADVPILGVPAGVKVYSAVFGVRPEAAGRLVGTFDDVETREINDIDEEAYREGDVRAELKAVASVPVDGGLQSSKQVLGGDVESVARGIADDLEPGVTYLLGPGGTLAAVKRAIGFEGSPLGVDVYRDGEVIARDANEREIRSTLGEDNLIVVSPIGGQGFVFGRGNAQLSPAVIEQSALEIVATREKLASTGVLRVDTGDASLDRELRGWTRVRVGRFERRMVEVV